MRKYSVVKGECPMTGPVDIDLDVCEEKWNPLWSIVEWRDEERPNWRLVKQLRKDSPVSDFKLTISEETAQAIIERINLVDVNVFGRSGWTWKKEEHWN